MPLNEQIAQLYEDLGRARAAGVAGAGQAYGSALGNIGQTVAALPAQMQQAAVTQDALNRNKVAADDLKAMDRAFSSTGGRDAILNALPGHLRPQVQASWSAADEAAAKYQEQQLKTDAASNDYIYTLATKIAAHGYDPMFTQGTLSHAKQTFGNNQSIVGQIQQLESQFQNSATPDAVKAFVDPIIAAHDAMEKPITVPATPREGGPAKVVKPSTFGSPTVIATGSPAAPTPPTAGTIESTAMDAYKRQAAGTATPDDLATIAGWEKTHPKPVESQEWKDVLLDGKPAKVFVDPKTKVVTTLGGQIVTNPDARIKPVPPASMNINPALIPSGDALDQAARNYLATSNLPSMGMGQAGAAARVAIMNRAAQIDPQAGIAANKANYGALSGTLKQLTQTEGTLSAFENTAGKNLDQFLSYASKVPDTGSPWINQPLRTVNAQVLGSADQAAFNAARDVALREIARVTNDPKLSGALTDSARREVSSLNPQSATFKQIKAVAQVLKQDMANVHSGLTQQIQTTKDALSAHPGAPASTAAAVPANVAAALKGATPGIHKLSDGSSWMLAADGTITKQ